MTSHRIIDGFVFEGRDLAVRVPMRSMERQSRDAFNLAMTQRRLAHRYKREANEAELSGNRARFLYCALECRRLWRDSKWWLGRARMYREDTL